MLDEARRAAGLRTDEGILEEALRLLMRMREQQEILGLAGKVRWTGDLASSPRGRRPPERQPASRD